MTMKIRFGIALLVGLVMVGMIHYFLLSERYDPGPDFILRESRWSPFVQDCREFDYAKFSFDNGALVFVMHPKFKSAMEYFDAVAQDLEGTGWSALPPGENPLAHERWWFAAYFRKTVARFTKTPGPTTCYTRKFFPDDSEDKTMEKVLLTYIEGDRAVAFVSWYEH